MYQTKLRSIPTNFAVESPSLRMTKLANLPRKGVDEDDAKRVEIGRIVDCINHHQRCELAWRTEFGEEDRGTTFAAKLAARMIVNSNGGILENAGLCLHRNFGFPYIPGSAVKGIARHAAWCDYEESDESEKIEKALTIARVFGYPTNEEGLDAVLESVLGKGARSGNVVFFEAIPESSAETEVDILNSHHMEYYRGDRDAALDNEDPNPCYFPVIKEGTSFVFRMKRNKGLSDADLKQAVRWLKYGLAYHGIGAKTAAGYGWFDIPDDKTDVSMDDGFLSELNGLYLKDGKPRGEAFKKDFKKGKIVADTDGKKRAFCQFVSDHKMKVGGEWQKDIDRMFEEFGMEVV